MNALKTIAAGTPVATITFPFLPSWNVIVATARGNRYAAASETTTWRTLGKVAANKLVRPLPNQCALVVRSWRKNHQRYDIHNLSTKAVLDGFTDAKIWEDDDVRHVPVVIFSHEGVDKNNPRVEIEIYDLEK